MKMPETKLSAAGITVLAIGIAIGFAAVLCWTSARRPSSLTKGLPSDWTAASSEFDGRVQTRFPVGSRAQKLANELDADGFKPTWFEANGEYGAQRDEGNLVCTVVARVFWRVGKSGALSTVRGSYGEEGCL